MANPLTEERLNHLKDQATELLKDFSILYLANFGACYFEKVKSELQPEEKPEWKLKHREFNSVPRKSPSSGCCYMKKGEGPGAFDKWKKVFVVERSDYNVDVFGSEKEFQSGKKPSSTIRTAGYTILKSQVAQHYSSQLNQLASGLGMTEVEVEEMTNFFPCTWALCHPQRINYIFQIPEIKDKSFFSCFGSKNQVEPTFDEESDKERNRLMDVMQTCVKMNHPRDVKCVHGAAFDKSYKAIPSKVSSLSKWKDDGSEGEMLVDMLMEACLSDLRDGILSDLKGPTSMKLAVWYKTRGVIQTTLAKLADPAMTQMQNGAKKIEEKIDPVIRPGIAKILEFKSSVEDKIKNKILSKLGEMIGKFVTPFLKPFLTAFEQPLNKGFENSKAYFNGEISVVNLPDNVEQRNSLLDGMSRSEECVKQVEKTSKELVEPLNALKKLSKDVFDDMDVDELRTKAHQLLLQTLDAAIYTIEQRLDAGQAKQDSLKTEILQDYEHDAKLARSIFVQEVVSSILITAFKKLISPVTDPLIDEFNNTIPPEMQDFLDVQQILDNLIEFIVGEPINSMVEVMYPKP